MSKKSLSILVLLIAITFAGIVRAEAPAFIKVGSNYLITIDGQQYHRKILEIDKKAGWVRVVDAKFPESSATNSYWINLTRVLVITPK